MNYPFVIQHIQTVCLGSALNTHCSADSTCCSVILHLHMTHHHHGANSVSHIIYHHWIILLNHLFFSHFTWSFFRLFNLITEEMQWLKLFWGKKIVKVRNQNKGKVEKWDQLRVYFEQINVILIG